MILEYKYSEVTGVMSFLHHQVQTGSGAHPASCSVSTEGSYHWR
jgi:hypothetical protein